MQFNPKALGYTAAIVAAGSWLLAMGFSLLTGIGYLTISTLGGFHPFFSYSWTGLVIVVIENLILGFILGWVFGWLYNKFATQ